MKAFVLINTQAGEEQKVKNKLIELDVFKFQSTGGFQFIAEVEIADGIELRDFVQNKIRNMDEVRSTLTMAASSSWSVN